MPRFARLHCPFALVHVIARFVNRSYRLAGPLERAAFLERIPAALVRCDWTLCAYALMSNHIHLAMWAGHAPVWQFLKPLHVSFARFVNGAHRMTGPVFSERATTIVMPTERLTALVAYLHNNPVRAGVVSRAAESVWTSHRAWIGLEPAPSWLAVDPALQQAGFDGSEQGRQAFDEYVTQRCADARDPTCSPAHLRQARRQLRRHCGLPIEVSSPQLGADERMRFELGMRAAAGCPGRWDGDLHELLRRISDNGSGDGRAVLAVASEASSGGEEAGGDDGNAAARAEGERSGGGAEDSRQLGESVGRSGGWSDGTGSPDGRGDAWGSGGWGDVKEGQYRHRLVGEPG